MSEAVLNETDLPTFFFFLYLVHQTELQLHQCMLDISQFHTSQYFLPIDSYIMLKIQWFGYFVFLGDFFQSKNQRIEKP